MGRKFITPPRFSYLAHFLAAIALLTTSCLNTGGGDNDCAKPFDKLVDPDKIENGFIYISVDKLDFLDEKNFVVEDVTLEAVVKGKKKPDHDFGLSLNGIKLSRNDGGKNCDKMTYEGDDTRAEFKLHKFYLNGGIAFELFLIKLKLQKGYLKLYVGNDVKSAKVRWTGKVYGKCPNPGPGPGPQPKPAATTKIDSVNPSASPTASTSMTINFSADQTGVTFYCSLDGAAASLCTSPKAYSNLSNGTHTFRVHSVNSSGVQETTPKVYTWTVDSVAPSATITNAAQLPALTNLTSVSFNFTANEAGTFECSLDNAAFAPCASPKPYGSLAEGQHTFRVRAIDLVGNAGAPASFSWVIDTTGPVTSIVQVNPGAGISNVNHRSFEFQASESAMFRCSVDNGAYSACTSPFEVKDLAEGPHYFEVYAVDAAGNQGISVGVAWKNDYTAPLLSFGTITPPPGLTSASNLAVEFAADEPATLYCSQDGAEAVECASPLNWNDVADGQHQLSVYAVDVAGNQSAIGTVDWTVDHTAPSISFASIQPSAAAYINSQAISFEIAASESVTLSMTMNGAQVTAENPAVFDGLPDGAYVFEVSATDGAGNPSGSISHSFVIDRVAPQLNVTQDPERPLQSDMRTLEFSASEEVTYQCDIDSAGFGACQSPLDLSGLADGEHTVHIKAIDLAGNETVKTAQWTVDTRPPVTHLTANQSGNSITFSFSADEAAEFVCSLDGATPTDCDTPITYSGLAGGVHTFTVWATDAAGNMDPAGASYSFIVQEPIKTFITGQTPSAALSNVNMRIISFAASRTPSGFLCQLDDGPVWFCVDPAQLTGLADGVHTFTVRALDENGLPDPVGASVTWTVDTTPPAVNNLSTMATTNSITVTWSTSEGATDQVLYGVGFTVNQATAESTVFTTSHSIKINGLSPNTTYTVQVFGRDQAGNTYLSATRSVRTSR